MQHQIKLISVCLLLFACSVIPGVAKPDVTYLSLKRPLSYSQNGRYAVMIVEDKYMGGSLFGLTLLVVDPRNGTQSFGMHALTPVFKEFVKIPDSSQIAYLQYDPVYAHSVNFFMPNTGDQQIGVHYASSGKTIRQLQFSKDGKYLCIFYDSTPHPFASRLTKMQYQIRKRIQKIDGWYIQQVSRNGNKKDPKARMNRLFNNEEKEVFTEWVSIEKPKELPQIFTQPMPTITQHTKVHWSPDPNSSPTYLFVSDDSGIWCIPLHQPLPEFIPMWTKLINAERIHRFELSPTGTQLVYEVRPELKKRSDEEHEADPLGLENNIWLVDLTSFLSEKPKQNPLDWELDVTAKIIPSKIAKGWGATFNPNGKSLIYANTDECNIISLETMEHFWVDWTARQ